MSVSNSKQDGIQYHFFSHCYDLTWDWTSVSQTISEHSIYLASIKNKNNTPGEAQTQQHGFQLIIVYHKRLLLFLMRTFFYPCTDPVDTL